MNEKVLWVGRWTFRVRHPISGRATDVTIPGADKMDPARLENLVEWQIEETLAELAGPDPMIASQPHSKAFQHDLGRTLIEVEESKKRVAETGHGKYWPTG